MAARRAPVAVARRSLFEVDAHLIGEGRHPRENVGELVLLLTTCSLADGLGEFAHFLCQPGNSRGHTSDRVALAVSLPNDLLQFAQFHVSTLGHAVSCVLLRSGHGSNR